MKQLILILAFVLAQISGNSQQNANTNIVVPKRNTFYLEAFGQGVFNSLSFDRLYRLDKKVRTSVTVGLTLMPWQNIPEIFMKNGPNHFSVIGAPVSYNWLFGKNNHHLELGVGLSYLKITQQIFEDYSKTYAEHYVYFTPKFSYRYQDPNGGLFFRMSLTPQIALMTKNSFGAEHYLGDAYAPYSDGNAFSLWAGVSLGWTMK